MIPGWKEEIEGEYLQILRESPDASPSDIATRLGVSEGIAVYWLTQLARDGRVRIRTIELVQDGEVPSIGGYPAGRRAA
jgi:Mn-dependent DtxR family transcriptional regulator